MEISPYAVGALLYAPASQENIARRVIAQKMEVPYSLALCLEDCIHDRAVKRAEAQLLVTLQTIAASKEDFYCPLIFVRVRTPEQIQDLYQRMGTGRTVFTGFIAPKFTADNAAAYLEQMEQINAHGAQTVYFMPILESQDLAEPAARHAHLCAIKEQLDMHRQFVLNVRVGGNDFCNLFGLRRHRDETIYEVGCIHHILTDIAAYFARDYVVSGPVWEYFDDPEGAWQSGMMREMQLDLLNGFTGKTVIHPNQIAVVNEMLRVPQEDYADACAILHMADHESVLVGRSAAGSRMNEYKTHTRWANKICARAEIYGVRE